MSPEGQDKLVRLAGNPGDATRIFRGRAVWGTQAGMSVEAASAD
jgi:hypothetical protein